MGGACSGQGGDANAYKIFIVNAWMEQATGNNQAEIQIILKCILGKSFVGADWTNLAQNMDRWRDIVKTENNLRFL
jgi:hypothetical protein